MQEEKSSISRVRKATGSYCFTIAGYSGVTNKVGESIESPEFTLCDHVWQLRIFPGGSLDAHKAHVSFYLASKSNRAARASYKLLVLSQIIGGNDEVFASSGVRLFEAKGVQIDGWGRDKFISIASLLDPSNGFIVDDTVIFKVEITVYGELEAAFPVVSINEGGPQTLARNLKTLFEEASNKASDIVVICRGAGSSGFRDSSGVGVIGSLASCGLIGSQNAKETRPEKGLGLGLMGGGGGWQAKGFASENELHAHKCILSARSPVFNAMLVNSDMKESRSGFITVEEDTVTMRELLHFMYTDELTEPSVLFSMSESLLIASLKYQVAGLANLSEEFLSRNIAVDNVISILKLSDAHCAGKLKLASLRFIAENLASVAQTKDFVELLNPKKLPNLSCFEGGKEEAKEEFDRESTSSDGWEALREELRLLMEHSKRRNGCGSRGGGNEGGERRFVSSCKIM